MFRNLNGAQYTWYKLQFDLDDEEEYRKLRDIAEHNAMFWNPEGVEQVKEARKNTFSTDAETFDKTVEELFGRKLNNEETPTDMAQALDRAKEDRATPYLNMELDEVNFIPIRGK